jgi:cytochrome oxidase assembly protein ShyY1
VKVTGRPLHNKAILIPSKSFGLAGYEYVVPIVTKETPEGDALEGVLLNKGFIPHEFAEVA